MNQEIDTANQAQTQMLSGDPPLSSYSAMAALPELSLVLFMLNFLAHLQACFCKLQLGKEPFILFVPQAQVTHAFICSSTFNAQH